MTATAPPWFGVVAALVLLLPGGARAQGTDGADAVPPATEPDGKAGLVSFGADVTFTTAYVWRGFVLGDDPSLQPSVWATIGPVTVSSWSNATVPTDGSAVYSEHDLSVDYAAEVRGLTLSFGWTHYAFVRETEGRYSNDVHLSIGGGGYLNPTVAVSQDVHQGSGTYVAAAVSHEYPLGWHAVRIEPTVSLGYNHRLWTDRSGFSDVTATVTLHLPLARTRLAAEPFLTYSWGLHAAEFPRRFLGGLVLTVE